VTGALRFAVAGYGQIAAAHTRRLAGDGHRLEWLVGRVPERTEAFAREHGYARHTTDLATALADPALDAVVLGTPNQVHAEQTAACLEAGKHVLVEIPLALSYAEGRQLADLARRTGLTLMVAHTHRFQGAMRWVRERVAGGDLRLEHAIARYLLLRRQNVGSSGYVRSWTDSLLWHHGQHSIDMVLWLLGVDRPGLVDVTAMFAPPDPAQRSPLEMAVLLRTEAGQLGTVALSYNSEVSQVYDYVLTTRGRTLVIEQGVLRDRDGVLYDPARDPGVTDWGLLQNREFAAAVREGRPASVGADDVLPALDVLQRAEALAPAGGDVPVPR
jgi:2-hydroxy-4-carboxymuconate semialdehyde hemiacetal dehydrogenase